MSKNSTKLTTASVLAFERKLDSSDAVFHAGHWTQRDDAAHWQPIAIAEKSVRGTISNRMKGSEPNPAKLDADMQKPNLQRVDVAALTPDTDTLKVSFTLRVLGNCGRPSACNNADYQARLLSEVAQYAATYRFEELARRYATNLANGRFLWRNRLASESVEVVVRQIKDGAAVQTWRFDALSFNLHDFVAPAAHADALAELAAALQQALAGNGYALFEVTAYARMGKGQEVYPSQELILDKGKDKKSKWLYSVAGIAGMHSQKIGNALRTIDDWHPSAAETGPISVEPYGSVTSLGRAFRQPKEKVDFYNLLDAWMLKDHRPEPNQQHYVIANLIRGGVYGEAEKD
jgi:CRISPR-associated protein Csy3